MPRSRTRHGRRCAAHRSASHTLTRKMDPIPSTYAGCVPFRGGATRETPLKTRKTAAAGGSERVRGLTEHRSGGSVEQRQEMQADKNGQRDLQHRCVLFIGLAVTIAVSIVVAGCGGRTPTQPSPPPEGPYTQCPADIRVESIDGNPIPVTWALPGASGGTPPLVLACTPPTETTFAVGEHTITCTVMDALSKTAACTFKVIVTTPPRVTFTQFTAYGDSLTYGVTSAALTPVQQRLLFQRALLAPPPAEAFPNQLEQMLRTRYKLQALNVYNEGIPGEQVDPGGLARMPNAIRAHPTEVLLLMEGTNDLSDVGGSDRAIDGLGRMVRDARARSVEVFLATVPPARAGGSYVPSRDVTARRIPPFNDQIRALAENEHVPLVDVYNAMRDRMYLIGIDDLHPTPEGYTFIAQTYFDVIRQHLEVKPPSQ